MQFYKKVQGGRFMNLAAVAIAFAALAGVSSRGVGQLPDRRTLPPARSPGVLTPSIPPGTLDPPAPSPGLDPGTMGPAAVRPGTIQREPTALPSRELIYLAPGEAPANVRVATTGIRSVTLEWSPTAGAHGYWVHQSHAQGPYYRGGSSTDTTTFTVTGLLPGTPYGFKVSATYPQEMQRGEGISAAVSATTVEAPPVSGLAAEVSGNEVNLTWSKAIEANWYTLHRNGAPLAQLKPVKVSQNDPPTHRTAYTDPAGPGTYQYQIQAVYLAGEEQVSSALAPTPAVSVTIKASTRVRYCQALNAPSACGQSGSKQAVIAASTALPQLRRNAP